MRVGGVLLVQGDEDQPCDWVRSGKGDLHDVPLRHGDGVLGVEQSFLELLAPHHAVSLLWREGRRGRWWRRVTICQRYWYIWISETHIYL